MKWKWGKWEEIKAQDSRATFLSFFFTHFFFGEFFQIIFPWIFLSFPSVKMERRERFMCHRLLGLIRQKKIIVSQKRAYLVSIIWLAYSKWRTPLVEFLCYVWDFALLCFGFKFHLFNVPRWRISIIPQKFRWQRHKRRPLLRSFLPLVFRQN